MRYKLLVTSLALPLFVGILGSVVTINSISTWYQGLVKPSFSPPNYLFAPIWTTLYILMGLSLYRVLKTKSSKKKSAVQILLIQLFLNFLWSLVFFGFHQIFLGFLVIIVLWLSIFQNIRVFLKISKPAGYLLAPYILWISIAAILNLSLFLLNR